MSDDRTKDTTFDFHRFIDGFDLPEFITRVAPDMRLRRQGHEHIGLCPFHGEKTPSFSIFKKGGRARYYCFGCGASGDALTFAQEYFNMNAKDALSRMGAPLYNPASRRNGLSGDTGVGDGHQDRVRLKTKAQEVAIRDEAEMAARKFEIAKTIYDEAVLYSEFEPRVGFYLKARGIDIDRIGGVPSVLKLAASSLHPDRHRYPAMIAPIADPITGEFKAVHRTFLEADGSGKAKIDKSKLVLGSSRGGVIMLYPPASHVFIAEGIETALSIRMWNPQATVWAAISLSNFASIKFPPQVRAVTLCADNDMKMPDDPRHKDPREMVIDAAKTWRATHLGLKVAVAWAAHGKDFNDMIRDQNQKADVK